MKRLLTPMMLGLLAAGCGGVIYPRTYLLDLDPRAAAPSARHAPAAVLAIREFACPDYLCDGRIVYRPTRTEVGYYEYHRWAMTLRKMITDATVRRIHARGVFTPVDWSQRDAAPYVLSGSIERLEEVDDGRDVHTMVELAAQVVDTRTLETVWRGSASASEPVATRDVPSVVDGLSAATRRAIDALMTSLETETALETRQ